MLYVPLRNFTGPEIAKHKPGTILTEMGSPGLRLHIGLRTETWLYRFRSPGAATARRVRLGRFPNMDIVSARAEWAKARALRDNGELLSKRDGGESAATRQNTHSA